MLAMASGVTVANLYYMQPLMVEVADSFSLSVNRIGLIVTLTQIGYATGLLFIVPLGDRMNRKSLILGMNASVVLILMATAVSPTVFWLEISCLLLGVTTVVPQLIAPYAASIVSETSRGRMTGTVSIGLFLGILLARVVSGWVGQLAGWRAMFWIAAGLMLILMITVWIVIPDDVLQKQLISYRRLMHSLWSLLKTEPTLRETCIFGALIFAAFSAFWTTIAFFLSSPPFHYGSGMVGMFGLVGAVGALAAGYAGRFSNSGNVRNKNAVAMLLVLLAFALMWTAGHWLWGLLLSVILLDLGSRANMTFNQLRIYEFHPNIRNRVTSIYMVCYYIGGSLGTLLGSYGWSHFHWDGVCSVATLLTLMSLVFYAVRSLWQS